MEVLIGFGIAAGLVVLGLFVWWVVLLTQPRASVRANELQQAVDNYMGAGDPVGAATTRLISETAFGKGPNGLPVMVPLTVIKSTAPPILEGTPVSLVVINRTVSSNPTPLVPRRSSQKVRYVSNQNSNTDEESNNNRPFSSSSSSNGSSKAKKARRARNARR